MDRARNPFAPGAGNRPPELAGRDRIIEDAGVTLQRIKAGRPDRGQLLLGLRGVGKTVLLNHINGMAWGYDYQTTILEASEESRLAEQLVPRLRGIILKLSARELTALIVSMHRVSQMNLPVIFFGAGLPQIAGLAGDAKSYAERLFRYPEVGQLAARDAAAAIEVPLDHAAVTIERGALDHIVEQTEGYPYFLQEWGYHSWNAAAESSITGDDVRRATADALSRLDSDFFRVRFDRLTPREKDYMRAMASLGPGPHRSADIAAVMGYTKADPLGSLRNDLVRKGMVYGRGHGVTAFTVPMFDAFMRRSMPDWTPKV
jgi:hypothetical protein